MKEEELENLNTVELMNVFEDIANVEFDGHYSILAFTTNYRVGFGTPLDYYEDEHGNPIRYEAVESFNTLREALISAITYKTSWN